MEDHKKSDIFSSSTCIRVYMVETTTPKIEKFSSKSLYNINCYFKVIPLNNSMSKQTGQFPMVPR